MRQLFLIAILAAVLSSCFANRALACSCGWVSQDGFLSTESDALPINARGLMWYGQRDPLREEHDPLVGRIRLYVIGPEGRVPVALESELQDLDGFWGRVWVLGPKAGFDAGKSYLFTYYRAGHKNMPLIDQAIEVSVMSAEFSPRLMSRLVVQKPTVGGLMVDAAGSCSWSIKAAQVAIDMELPPAMKPFRNHLYYETFVDGEKWLPRSSLCEVLKPGVSWQGPAKDLIYVDCDHMRVSRSETDPYPGRGVHQVKMTAWLPGTDIEVSTPEVEVRLDCRRKWIESLTD